jgi:hypothetical protein
MLDAKATPKRRAANLYERHILRSLRSVMLLTGGIVGLALGHIGVGVGALILGGVSLAAFFWD